MFTLVKDLNIPSTTGDNGGTCSQSGPVVKSNQVGICSKDTQEEQKTLWEPGMTVGAKLFHTCEICCVWLRHEAPPLIETHQKHTTSHPLVWTALNLTDSGYLKLQDNQTRWLWAVVSWSQINMPSFCSKLVIWVSHSLFTVVVSSFLHAVFLICDRWVKYL